MKETIIELYNFQVLYLQRLLENIPENRLYEKQLEGYNSAGWLLGHICVEVEDILNYLHIPYKKVDPQWHTWFKSSSGKLTSLDHLPSKEELFSVLFERYSLLAEVYLELTGEQRQSEHPSIMLRSVLFTLDSWIAHHLTTHIAIHCGNIVVWKKMIGLEVNGY